MSALMTNIHLPGANCGGLADWGKKTPKQMIALWRRHARAEKRDAEKILQALDEDFEVYTCHGHIVQRNKRVLQAGKKLK